MQADSSTNISGMKLGTWPWEGPMEYGLDEPGLDDGTRSTWEKTFPQNVRDELDIGQCVCVIGSMSAFQAATGRGSVKASGWMVDIEILDSGFGQFYYHVEKRVQDEAAARLLAKKLMDFVDSKTLDELINLPKSGKMQMSIFEGESGTGRSQYTTAFTHPDPLDPNDAQRQRTQSRSKEFPYDRKTSYGSALVPDSGGAAREVSYGGQLTPWFMPDDDGDIEQEAIGTPINFKQSDGGGGSGALPIPGQSRGFAGSTKDNLDIDTHWDVFGEDSFVRLSDAELRDLQTGELRDISVGSMGLVGQGLVPQANQMPANSLVDALGFGEDVWPLEVRSNQLRALSNEEFEDMSLGECFAVYNPDGPEVISLLETLDWEG